MTMEQEIADLKNEIQTLKSNQPNQFRIGELVEISDDFMTGRYQVWTPQSPQIDAVSDNPEVLDNVILNAVRWGNDNWNHSIPTVRDLDRGIRGEFGILWTPGGVYTSMTFLVSPIKMQVDGTNYLERVPVGFDSREFPFELHYTKGDQAFIPDTRADNQLKNEDVFALILKASGIWISQVEGRVAGFGQQRTYPLPVPDIGAIVRHRQELGDSAVVPFIGTLPVRIDGENFFHDVLITNEVGAPGHRHYIPLISRDTVSYLKELEILDAGTSEKLELDPPFLGNLDAEGENPKGQGEPDLSPGNYRNIEFQFEAEMETTNGIKIRLQKQAQDAVTLVKASYITADADADDAEILVYPKITTTDRDEAIYQREFGKEPDREKDDSDWFETGTINFTDNVLVQILVVPIHAEPKRYSIYITRG